MPVAHHSERPLWPTTACVTIITLQYLGVVPFDTRRISKRNNGVSSTAELRVVKRRVTLRLFGGRKLTRRHNNAAAHSASGAEEPVTARQKR
ncbi:hypothetical protein JTB14_032883 [Gonioctena quinquepunctata]|nr:hypothetical protein JTB14_032883 [Gonioctena quinquepunctata]